MPTNTTETYIYIAFLIAIIALLVFKLWGKEMLKAAKKRVNKKKTVNACLNDLLKEVYRTKSSLIIMLYDKELGTYRSQVLGNQLEFFKITAEVAAKDESTKDFLETLSSFYVNPPKAITDNNH